MEGPYRRLLQQLTGAFTAISQQVMRCYSCLDSSTASMNSSVGLGSTMFETTPCLSSQHAAPQYHPLCTQDFATLSTWW